MLSRGPFQEHLNFTSASTRFLFLASGPSFSLILRFFFAPSSPLLKKTPPLPPFYPFHYSSRQMSYSLYVRAFFLGTPSYLFPLQPWPLPRLPRLPFSTLLECHAGSSRRYLFDSLSLVSSAKPFLDFQLVFILEGISSHDFFPLDRLLDGFPPGAFAGQALP